METSSSKHQQPQRKRKKLPLVGCKINRPLNPEEEKDEVHTLLLQHKDLLMERKVDIDKLLISAEWDPQTNEARVTKNCGNSLEVFGHSRNRSVYLYPEEALYLIEMNKLQLFYDDVRTSIQRAYALLLNPKAKVTSDVYRVFKHFLVYGYKLFRHENVSLMGASGGSVPASACIPKADAIANPYEDCCQKLRIFEPVSANQTSPDYGLSIAYDVFESGSVVKKSNRPDPDYYLIIIRHDEKIDSIFKIISSFNRTNLLFAQVSGNSISVFNMHGTPIPNLC